MEGITESENKIQLLNSWLEAQEERLHAFQRPEAVASLERLLLDCQVSWSQPQPGPGAPRAARALTVPERPAAAPASACRADNQQQNVIDVFLMRNRSEILLVTVAL